MLGSMLIEDLEAHLGIEIDPRDEDTIAGVALSEIGRLPRVSDRVTVGPIELEVLEVELNRILSLKVNVNPGSAKGPTRPSPPASGDP